MQALDIDTDRIIEPGDEVTVRFYGSKQELCPYATVLKLPEFVGDYWVFENDNDSHIHYVSEGCTVTLTCKADEIVFEPELDGA